MQRRQVVLLREPAGNLDCQSLRPQNTSLVITALDTARRAPGPQSVVVDTWKLYVNLVRRHLRDAEHKIVFEPGKGVPRGRARQSEGPTCLVQSTTTGPPGQLDTGSRAFSP
jgi:hypothetical protein